MELCAKVHNASVEYCTSVEAPLRKPMLSCPPPSMYALCSFQGLATYVVSFIRESGVASKVKHGVTEDCVSCLVYKSDVYLIVRVCAQVSLMKYVF